MIDNEKLAILDYLLDQGYSVMTEEIIDYVNDLKEELETLDSNSDLYNEILEKLEEYDDYIGPDDLDEERYDHYGLNVYSVPKLDESYAVGTTDEADSALEVFIRSIIEDGYRSLSDFIYENVKYVDNYIDDDKLSDDLQDYYEYVINNDPESHLDDSDRELSSEQKERIKILENRIAKYEGLKSKRSDPNKIEDINSVINKLNEKIDEIKESPEGYYSDESIRYRAIMYVESEFFGVDLINIIGNYGYDIEEYFDLDKYISDAVKDESYESLSSYDGNYYETKKIDGNYYIVIRTK
jgi:hypothetical protein